MLAQRLDLLEKAKTVATQVAAKHAASVDAEARFPKESVEALKAQGLLGAAVPTQFGGEGCSLGDVLSICHVLGQQCASSAMVFAMHQIQVACVVRHAGESTWLQDFMRELAGKQWLLASATSEVGIGGDARTSSCAVERQGDSFALTKLCSTLSYGVEADGILATARRAPDAPSSDQVLVALPKSKATYARTGTWDTLGMRGTCSQGGTLTGQGSVAQILPLPYGDISARTMVPYSHLTWASLWLGIATNAVGRARAFIRAEARKKPGTTPPGAVRLAELVNLLQLMKANVVACAKSYEAAMNDPEALTAIGFAIEMNTLKAGTSQLLVQIVNHALLVCGIHGYKNDTPYALGRHLRDSHSSIVMVSNDRIFGATASLLLVHKEDTSL